MPISLNLSKENGLEFNGVRAIVIIGLLMVVSILAIKGNAAALGAIIPLASRAIEGYIQAKANGKQNGVTNNVETSEISVSKASPIV